MKIILGCFGQSYSALQTKFDLVEYTVQYNSFGNIIKEGFYKWGKRQDYSLLAREYPEVCYACHEAQEIYFDLTEIKFPFNTKVITLLELDYVINHVELLLKTKFFINGQQVNTNVVCKLFIENQPVSFGDLQELFTDVCNPVNVFSV